MLFLAKRNRPKQAFSEAALDAVPENAMRRWRIAEKNDLNGRFCRRGNERSEAIDAAVKHGNADETVTLGAAVNGNSAGSRGGGVYIASGTLNINSNAALTMSGVLFYGNTAKNSGNSWKNNGGTVTVDGKVQSKTSMNWYIKQHKKRRDAFAAFSVKNQVDLRTVRSHVTFLQRHVRIKPVLSELSDVKKQ